jgi:hypothetical protein
VEHVHRLVQPRHAEPLIAAEALARPEQRRDRSDVRRPADHPHADAAARRQRGRAGLRPGELLRRPRRERIPCFGEPVQVGQTVQERDRPRLAGRGGPRRVNRQCLHA